MNSNCFWCVSYCVLGLLEVTLVFPNYQFCSNEEANEIEEFFATRPHEAVAMDLKQSLEQVRIKARWVEFIRQDHSLPDLIEKLAAKGSS